MKRLHVVVAAAALAALAACTDSTAPSGAVYGRYVLRTVNGSSLPYNLGVDNTGTMVEIIADTLWVNSNSDYNETVYYRETNNAGTTINPQDEVGTWTALNGSITFYDQTDGGIQYQGSVSGTTLTEIQSGYTQVYQKQ